jgi:hypothetical protein
MGVLAFEHVVEELVVCGCEGREEEDEDKEGGWEEGGEGVWEDHCCICVSDEGDWNRVHG